MSPKIVVRTKMPDTNSSSGTFVAFSSPPPQEMDVFPSLHYGSYMVLVPSEIPRADKATPRLVTLRGRAQWLLGILVDGMPLPQQLVGSITSEEKALEMRGVLEQYLAGHMDSEIEEFVASVELEEARYGQRIRAKRELLKRCIELLENPREGGLPAGIPHPARVVIRVLREHAYDVYFPAGSPPGVKAPLGWVIGSFSPGEDEGYIKIESGRVVPGGKMFQKGGRRIKYLESIRHRILSTPLPGESFVAEILRGYLAPEYLPEGLLNPHPFLSPAEPVSETERLFCISAGAKTPKTIERKLRGFSKKTQTGGVLRSATLFCPSGQSPLEERGIGEEKKSVEENLTLFLYDFASRCGMSVTIPLDVIVRTSYDNWFHLSLLCSTSLFEPVLKQEGKGGTE